MKPTLVILAAGIGSRYGRAKQLQPVGPGGATMMDYAVYDAARAGFGKVVFVIRPDMETAFRTSVGRRCETHIPVAYAHQRRDSLPAGFALPPGCTRQKPWGTGHALLATTELVQEPLAVVNADDFYGADSYAALYQFLSSQREDNEETPTYAMMGYRLRDTLSDSGSVSRAVCRCMSDGWLQSIVEIMNIEKHGTDGKYTDDTGMTRVVSGDEPVSMNMWGFSPTIFDQLHRRFHNFLQEHCASNEAELYLPTVIQDLVRNGRARVKVLPGNAVWCGVTYPQDKTHVEAIIRDLVARGEYPRKLWD